MNARRQIQRRALSAGVCVGREAEERRDGDRQSDCVS